MSQERQPEPAAPTPPQDSYLRYRDDLEEIQPDEQETFQQIADSMRRIGEMMMERYRHAVRSVHAKSHAIVIGDFEVYDGLPERLAQGLFAHPGHYPVILRFSTSPGDILPDSISTPRGLSIKIIGPPDQAMLDGHEGQVTQDFVMVNGPTFRMKDAAAFLKSNLIIEKNAGDPDQFKELVAFGARTADKVLNALGEPKGPLTSVDGQLKNLGGHPTTHPLGEQFYTQLPMRYGDYVAKLSVAPASGNLRALKDQPVQVYGHPGALRDALEAFFKDQEASWEVQIQLATSLEDMPIEDASAQWSEEQSPFLTVGRISTRPQAVYSPERRVYGDELLSFSPWHGLAAHRPLGNVMRARKLSYETSAKYRHEQNARPLTEPRSAEDLPQ